jgi:hypothetical protein
MNQSRVTPIVSQNLRNTSSLLKNVKVGISLHLTYLEIWGAMVLRGNAGLRRQQFGNADQVVGDQIEREVGSDPGSATMFGPAHRAVLLAQPIPIVFVASSRRGEEVRPRRIQHGVQDRQYDVL